MEKLFQIILFFSVACWHQRNILYPVLYTNVKITMLALSCPMILHIYNHTDLCVSILIHYLVVIPTLQRKVLLTELPKHGIRNRITSYTYSLIVVLLVLLTLLLLLWIQLLLQLQLLPLEV